VEGFLIMKLTFLGTGAGSPCKFRNVSSIALQIQDGSFILFDCGEGTQHQILKSDVVKISKISHIFITHLHGDHCFGLPGLLATISMNSIKPSNNFMITIIGPLGIKNMLLTSLSLSSTFLSFSVLILELVPPSSFDSNNNNNNDTDNNNNNIFMGTKTISNQN